MMMMHYEKPADIFHPYNFVYLHDIIFMKLGFSLLPIIGKTSLFFYIIFLSCGETSLNVSNTTRACLRQSAHESAARLRAGALLFR